MKKLNREQILSIKDMRKEGKTTATIAQSLSVSPATIQYWINRSIKAGIDMKTNSKRGVKAIEL